MSENSGLKCNSVCVLIPGIFRSKGCNLTIRERFFACYKSKRKKGLKREKDNERKGDGEKLKPQIFNSNAVNKLSIDR